MSKPVKEFWVSSGHHLLDRSEGGGLVVTDEFLKLYLARPEILPPEEACEAEHLLHKRLMIAPHDTVTGTEIAALADADARENWQVLIAFRDYLLKHPTLEAAYLALARQGVGNTPPLMLNQLVHAILRNALDDETDSFILRAAECFFRPQRLSIRDGQLLLADEEIIEGHEQGMHSSPLTAMFAEAKSQSLDVLTAESANTYHSRSDAFDMVLDFAHGGAGRAALARVIERWVSHLLHQQVTVEPLERVEDKALMWFCGLDAEGTAIGNALWKGESPPLDQMARLTALFRLTFDDTSAMIERVRGKPVYLILGVNEQQIMRIKPQNLAAGLPVREGAG